MWAHAIKRASGPSSVLVTLKQTALHTPRVACVFDTRAVCAAQNRGGTHHAAASRSGRRCKGVSLCVLRPTSATAAGASKLCCAVTMHLHVHHTVAAVSVWANALGRGAALLSTEADVGGDQGQRSSARTFRRDGKQCRLAISWQTRQRSLGLMCDADPRCPALHCPLYPQTNAHRSVINLSGTYTRSPHPSTPLGRQKAERSHVKVFFAVPCSRAYTRQCPDTFHHMCVSHLQACGTSVQTQRTVASLRAGTPAEFHRARLVRALLPCQALGTSSSRTCATT